MIRKINAIVASKDIKYELKEVSICQPVKQPGVIDHNALKAVFEISTLKRGLGYWKLNNSVLKDQQYLQGVHEVIDLTLREYQEIKSFQLVWEILKICIKEYTIHYCIDRKRDKSNKIKNTQITLDKLNEDILFLETKDKLTKVEKELLLIHKTKKLELESICNTFFEDKAKGYCVRSRTKWLEEGEVCSRYFLSLEKQRQSENVIKKVKVDDKYMFENNDILEESVKFYQNLYSKTCVSPQQIQNYLGKNRSIKTLNKREREFCDKEISKAELREIVKNLKCNKAPGLDGLTNEFYQTFWNKLEPTYSKMLEESFTLGILPSSVRKAVMTLIFKKGDKTILKNYRPISLTNCDYKILTFVLTKRLQQVVTKLISQNQSGYIKNRYIGYNARLILDIIEDCKKHNNPGAIICLDFEKAFDSLNWHFMFATLEKFGFGHITFNSGLGYCITSHYFVLKTTDGFLEKQK